MMSATETRRRGNVRVVHITTVHHPRDPRIFYKQLATLRDAGYDVHFVVPCEQTAIVEGVSIAALPSIEGRYQRVALQWPAYRTARKLNADLYHIHDPELIPLAYLLQRTTGARIIYDMHENYWWHGPIEGRLLRLLERWCFGWVDHVVVANPTQLSIPQASQVPATVVANYHDSSHCLPSMEKPPVAQFRLVYAGVLSEQRGLTHLIDLATRLAENEMQWCLKLVGICNLEDQRHRAERRIQQQNIEEVFRRVGWDRYVPWPDLIAHCHSAHVGLVLWNPTPHHLETIPTKFYQYLHAGLPILCTDLPQWRQFIERHDCGAVVPPGDTEAAFGVLQRWHSNPDRYRALSEAAREAAKQYRWASEGRRLVRLYDTLLGVTPPSE